MNINTFIKGFIGEQETRLIQGISLDPRIYHGLSDILIPSNNGYTQIDNIIVSRYGIFVIENKNYSGYIYGNINDKTWTQKIYKHTSIFLNPLVQNKLHIESLAKYCSINKDKIFSVIVFSGDCKLKTEMPTNVMKSDKYISYIKSKKEIILSYDESLGIIHLLDNSKNHIPILTNIHNANVIKNQKAHNRP
jgi:hypothetical protein